VSCKTWRGFGFLVTLASCETCPPDIHVIRALRVLGTEATPPIGSPNGAVTVRVVTADVETRDVSVVWYRCPQPLQLIPNLSSGGSLEDAPEFVAQGVARCMAGGVVARGERATIVLDSSGGLPDEIPYRPLRRWTDLVGFACASGTIEPAPPGGVWPRCTGTRGVVFVASIPGPPSNGSTTESSPASLTRLTFDNTPWGDNVVPTVAPCAGQWTTCEPHVVEFSVANADRIVDATLVSSTSIPPSPDTTVLVRYEVTASAPFGASRCETSLTVSAVEPTDTGTARFRWVPGPDTGEVTFWITTRRFTGGLVVTRRKVRVQ
jgi:hypothetical protein